MELVKKDYRSLPLPDIHVARYLGIALLHCGA